MRGAGAPLNGVMPSELIMVFTKLSEELEPVPPSSSPTRFKLPLFGAIRFISRSPTYVWLAFKVTLTSEMLDPIGIPETVIGISTPAGKSSGIGTAAAELNTTVVLAATLVIVICCPLPPIQRFPEVGVTNATKGFTTRVTMLLKSVPLHPPA